MNIENKIPNPTGFTAIEDSIFSQDFQKLHQWFVLIKNSVKDNELSRFSGVALHLLKGNELGGTFFADVTYVHTIEEKQDLWVENPPPGILLTFACGFVTSEQKQANSPWPPYFKDTYPPLWIIEFVLENERDVARSFLGWSSEFKGSLLLNELELKHESSWEDMLVFINEKSGVLKTKNH